MTEVGEGVAEREISGIDTPSGKESKKMTFDDVKEKAWELSHENLSVWKGRLDEEIRENALGINQHFSDLAVLYGKSPPERVLVSLQYYPSKGRHKGEPINNFSEPGRLDERFADVIYWVPEPESDQDYEKMSDQILQKLLHEAQHISFQRGEFQDFVKKTEQLPEVVRVLDRLGEIRGEYMEVTTELVTTYVESHGHERLEEAQENDEGLTTPLVIEVDKEKSGEVFEAVVKEDVEGWRDKGKGPGPYTMLRQGWEKLLGGLPEGYGTKNEPDVTRPDSDTSYKGTRIYEIAEELDTGLVDRYVREGKRIDQEFIVELYEMVEESIETN